MTAGPVPSGTTPSTATRQTGASAGKAVGATTTVAIGQPLLTVTDLKVWFPITGGVLRRRTGWVYAVDGISLTVWGIRDGAFTVALIPYTLEVTNLRDVQVGCPVNLEADVIAKYVERLLIAREA